MCLWLRVVEVGLEGSSVDQRDDQRDIRYARSCARKTQQSLTIRGITAKLHVSPGAKPRFHRPRSIPYALRSRVDEALENLVSKGILEAVQLSEWAAPIVPVIKRDSSIRVC